MVTFIVAVLTAAILLPLGSLQAAVIPNTSATYQNIGVAAEVSTLGCSKSDQRSKVFNTKSYSGQILPSQLLEKGLATYKTGFLGKITTSSDICESGKLREYFCVTLSNSKKSIASYLFECPEGSACEDGKCVAKPIVCNPNELFSGDGTYNVAVGDSITAANGISITFTRTEVLQNNFVSFDADFYAGADKLNMMPVKLTNGDCLELFGVYIKPPPYLALDQCGKVPVKVASFFQTPIDSAVGLYQSCINMGIKHSICSDYIPWQVAPNEYEISSGKLKVYSPSGGNSQVSQFLLNQLSACYNSIANYFGVTEVFPNVSLRWYFGDGGYPINNAHVGYNISWSFGMNQSTMLSKLQDGTWNLGDSSCHEPTIAHELSHLLRAGIVLKYYIEEGLAMHAQLLLGTKQLQATPYYSQSVSAGSVIPVPASQTELTISAIDYENKKLTYKYKYLDKDFVASLHRFFYLTNKQLALVTDISPTSATIQIYNNPELKYTSMPICEPDGYATNANGFLKDNAFYQMEGDENAYFHHPYQSLDASGFGESGYFTGYCFWRLLAETYGEEIIPAFLSEAAKVREKNLSGMPETFCWIQKLSELTGADLSQHFAKFGLTYDLQSCMVSGGTYVFLDANTQCPAGF